MELHYETVGSGPALVLVHGGVMDLGMWDGQVEAFSRAHRVIRFDLRGFGESPDPRAPFSPAADLRALLDRLGVERAHVLGASLGGAIAIDFALAWPERVASLILPEPVVAGWQYSAEVMRSMGPVISALQAGDREAAIEAMLETPAFAHARSHRPEAFETIESLVSRNFDGLMAQRLMSFERPTATDALGEISVPTLLLVSEAPGPDARRIAERLQAAIPGAARVVIEGSGHLMNLEQPDAFNRAVLEFLGRHVDAEPRPD